MPDLFDVPAGRCTHGLHHPPWPHSHGLGACVEYGCRCPSATRVRFECETCGLLEVIAPDEAFQAGWDYPPEIGAWGVISPRTCPNCGIETTAWWALTKGLELSPVHRLTIARIQAEGPDGYGAPKP